MINALASAVHGVLVHPGRYQWTVQGFGMLRTYLDADRKIRLNVWDKRIQKPNVSLVHDHPWDFTSHIISGEIINLRYVESPEFEKGWPFSYATIKCGPGGGMVNCQGDIDLVPGQFERYRAGESYSQKANEIHETDFWSGTVTLNDRTFHPDTEHARVFWRRGQQWVDAEPRVATMHEIKMVTVTAHERWDAR